MQNDDLNSFLNTMGWNDFFQKSFDENSEPGQHPGRVVSQGRGHYHVQIAPHTVIEASVASKLRHVTKNIIDFPGVGDWVTMSVGQGAEKANIHSVLKRKTLLQRKRGGGSQEPQLIATNVDTIFIVTSLNEDFDV